MRKRLFTLPLLALCVSAPLAPVFAQDEDPGTTRSVRTRGIEAILRNLSRGSGLTVLADSSLAETQAAPPREETTAQNLEAQLTQLVRGLPAGTVWTKVMLPATTRNYRGDDVVDYIAAQTKLLGKKVGSDPSVIEVLGQKLPQETPVVGALNLKPVYVIYNPTARARAAAGTEGTADVNKMLQSFMNMDPNTRQQMMRGMMQQFGSMMQNMSPEQRMEFMRSMRGAFPGGPGGGPGGGGGRIPPQR